MRAAVLVISLAYLGFVPAVGRGQVTEKDLEDRKKRFEEAEERERDRLLKEFDTVAKRVGSTAGIPAEVRVKRVAVINTEKAAFKEKGTLPACDDMLPALWEHMNRLHAARRPLARAYESALNAALKAGNAKLAQQLAREKATYDEHLPGRNTFQAKTNWNGYRAGPMNNIPFHFHVGTCDGNAVKGRMWQDEGKVEMVVEGKLDGNFIEVKTVKLAKGENRNLTFTGFVLEDRLVFQVSGVTPKGQPARGIVLLNRVK